MHTTCPQLISTNNLWKIPVKVNYIKVITVVDTDAEITTVEQSDVSAV